MLSIHERIKAAADVDYPAYGVTGPSKDVTPSGGDRKLAQSAHMYHYQHQKQQMAALQKGAIQGDRQGSGGSDVESDDDNEDGDYTVYECPGLAPAGEMEVKNPLFQDEPTPATPQTSKGSEEEEAEAASPEKK
ncbi:Neural proliferation differentiation and control protein 1 [Orchesella cincta]|uniref:Neural proliferation differentiation and control protein 1 n=1 Tax=Orchesella cincta TaxID=48709 RepID=A0A1D2NDJ0_ORCCI|nr:Neural proliferation differentiation and control protein 1 [Orchesella cincta]